MIMFLKKKEKAPFKTGDIVSDGKNRMIVNVVFKKGNEWRMLVDTHEWIWNEGIAYFCDETVCDGWYLVK